MRILVHMALFIICPLWQQRFRCLPAAQAQCGQGALEFTLAVVPVLLAALGALEAIHWYNVRHTVNQALMQGLRAGITEHARPQAIAAAFDQSMLLLFPPTTTASAQQNQQRRYRRHTLQLGAPWHMQILSPTAAHYAAHADPSLAISQSTGLAAIRNSYQREQHLQSKESAPGAGNPPVTGQPPPLPDIFQANTLSVRVVFPHSPLLPGMRSLFTLLGKRNGSVNERTFAAGYLPVVQQLSLPMQSDPVQWPIDQTPGFFSTGPGQATHTSFGVPANKAIAPCTGLWCNTGKTTNKIPAPEQENEAEHPAHGLPHLDEPHTNPPGQAVQLPPNDPQCGVTVCCLS